MTVNTIAGTANTLASVIASGYVMEMDVRAPEVMAGDTLRFDPNASTTLTIDNANLMNMGTIQMRPASNSIVHKILFTSLNDNAFTGGGVYTIAAVSGSGTTRTLSLQLRAAQPNHNLHVNDNIVLSQFYGSLANYPIPLPNYTGTFPINSVGPAPALAGGVQTVTVQFPSDPGAHGLLVIDTHAGEAGLRYASAVAESPAVNDHGLWHMNAAVFDAVGTTKLGWARSLTDLAVGATTVTLDATPTGWAIGDEVVFSPTDYSYDHDEVRTLTGVSGSTVTFAALTYVHPLVTVKAGMTFGCEVANLTRNVRIEGESLTKRTHMMFHNTSPVAQTIKYVQLRYMGPREIANAGQGGERKIVGRWPWHFHKEGANSVGSLLEGCVVRDSGSHAYVQHASNGVTIRDCISYHNQEDSFWWDQDSDADRPDGVVWNHNMVGFQYDTNDLLRMAGFLMAQTVTQGGATMTDCCTWGVRGGKQGGGAGWDTEGGSSPVATKWLTTGVSIFHNNRFNGFGSWINAPDVRSDHFDFVLYRNGASGLSPDGAYSTNLSYERMILFENAWGVSPDGDVQWIAHANGKIDPNGKWSVRSDFYVDAGGFSQGMKLDHTLSPGAAPTQWTDCHFRNCIAPALRIDNPRTIPVFRIIAVSGSGTTRVLTLQLVAPLADLTTKPSPAFEIGKNLVLGNFYGSLANYPTPLASYTGAGPITAIGVSSGVGGTQTVTVQFTSDPGAAGALSIAGPSGTIYASAQLASTSQPQRRDLVRCSIRDIGASVDHDVTLADFDLQKARGRDLVPGTTIRVQARDDASAFQIYVPVDVHDNAEFLTNMVVTTIAPFALRVVTQSLPAATANVVYPSQTLVAVSPEYTLTGATWALKSGSDPLPTGLSISSGGVISGTPTVVGTYTSTVEVTDARGITAPKTYSIIVGSGVAPLQITTSGLPGGFVGTSYSPQTLVATGGTAPYTWSLSAGSGPLPPGLFLSTNGVISGTPTTQNTYLFIAKVTDNVAATATRQLSIGIQNLNPVISTPSIPVGEIGIAYNFALTATGGTPPYTWSVISGTLPAGISLSAAMGILSGTPTTATTTSPTIRVTDAIPRTGDQAFSFQIAAAVFIPAQFPPPATVGNPYSFTFIAEDGIPPYIFFALGEPPPGLDIDGNGVLSGMPQEAGDYNFTVNCFDAADVLASRNTTVTVKEAFLGAGRGARVRGSQRFVSVR